MWYIKIWGIYNQIAFCRNQANRAGLEKAPQWAKNWSKSFQTNTCLDFCYTFLSLSLSWITDYKFLMGYRNKNTHIHISCSPLPPTPTSLDCSQWDQCMICNTCKTPDRYNVIICYLKRQHICNLLPFSGADFLSKLAAHGSQLTLMG